MGDKSPKAKQKGLKQKGVAEGSAKNKAKAKQDSSNRSLVPAGKGKR